LQKLLLRAEQDPRYLGALTQRSKKIANKFTPTKERDSWRRVLAKF